MIDLFSLHMILLYAVFYGITMKVADLFNEHEFKWFKHADVLFGSLWGIFGALLVISNMIIGNVILAMIIAFLIRRRIDHINHAIAVIIIFIVFLVYVAFNPIIFVTFFLVFLIFGSLKDYTDDVFHRKKDILFILSETMLYYPIPTFIYCWFYGNWILFYGFLLYTLAYDLTKYYAMKKGYK